MKKIIEAVKLILGIKRKTVNEINDEIMREARQLINVEEKGGSLFIVIKICGTTVPVKVVKDSAASISDELTGVRAAYSLYYMLTPNKNNS